MKPEIPAKGGGEQDAFTGWRKVLCYMQRSGVVKAIQRRYNKRVRQYTKIDLARELDEYEDGTIQMEPSVLVSPDMLEQIDAAVKRHKAGHRGTKLDWSKLENLKQKD
jgi:hypothetical protein